MENAVLLVIDIQKDNISEDGPYPFPAADVQKLIQNVNQLTASCNASQVPVIFVRQVFDGFLGTLISRLFLKGITLKGKSGAELDDRLNQGYGETLDKPSQNAFAKTNLDQQLTKLNIDHIFICGLDGAYCVSATAKGGLATSRNVTFIEDAIITNKPEKWSKLKSGLADQGVSMTDITAFIDMIAH